MEHHEHQHYNTLETDILVVGAGIAGITSALEAGETGFKVILIEKNSYIGGRVAQLNEYFPKMCPPTCGLEINIKRLKDNKNIQLLTLTEVESIMGNAGNYKVIVKQKPRYVKDDAIESDLIEASNRLTSTIPNSFNFGLDRIKPLYIAYNNAYPQKYLLDKKACTEDELNFLSEKYSHCIDLDQKEEHFEIHTKAVIWASGWQPYDAKKIEILGYGTHKGIITNMLMERLSAPNGPTNGYIKIPDYDKEIKSVAFVQCAGSRDENHLEYCSSICCLATMKQAKYIREKLPESEIYIFYIDIRSPGILEDLYTEAKEDRKIHFHRGKVAKVFKNEESDKLVVEAEDTLSGMLKQTEVDLVVLATGMEPMAKLNGFPDLALIDDNGFIKTEKANCIIGCGVATGPKEVSTTVQDATGAVMKAIHIIKGGK